MTEEVPAPDRPRHVDPLPSGRDLGLADLLGIPSPLAEHTAVYANHLRVGHHPVVLYADRPADRPADRLNLRPAFPRPDVPNTTHRRPPGTEARPTRRQCYAAAR